MKQSMNINELTGIGEVAKEIGLFWVLTNCFLVQPEILISVFTQYMYMYVGIKSRKGISYEQKYLLEDINGQIIYSSDLKITTLEVGHSWKLTWAFVYRNKWTNEFFVF